MSKDEAEKYSNRELTRELINSLELHKKESAEFREEVKESLAKIGVHHTYTAKSIIDVAKLAVKNDAVISDLVDNQNKVKGGIFVSSLLGGIAIIGGVGKMIFDYLKQ